jgi:hypothetical protein
MTSSTETPLYHVIQSRQPSGVRGWRPKVFSASALWVISNYILVRRTSSRNHEVPSRLRDIGSDKSYADLDPESVVLLYSNHHVDAASRDQRPLAEKLESTREHEKIKNENAQTVTDPLAPARAHGHEASRGAQIDAKLHAEEVEILKKKERA